MIFHQFQSHFALIRVIYYMCTVLYVRVLKKCATTKTPECSNTLKDGGIGLNSTLKMCPAYSNLAAVCPFKLSQQLVFISESFIHSAQDLL